MAAVIILAVVAGLVVWALTAVALALLTGGLIHEREIHDDRPLEDAVEAPADGLLPDDVVRARVA
jgi:hypothetical protein